MAFGHEPHMCTAPLARLELEVCLNANLDKFARYTLVTGAINPADLADPRVRLRHLPVSFVP